MRVLYVSHTGQFGGGEISLLELLSHLPSGVEPMVAVPAGPFESELRRRGLPTLTIPGAGASLRVTARSVAASGVELARSAWSVRSICRRLRVDLVHANSLRAGVIVGLAGVSPAIVFARDALPPSRVASASQRFVARRVACIVANSRFTAARFAAAAGCPAPTIIHPPVDLQRFSADGVDRSASRIRLGLSDDEAPVIGVVAQLTPWKGQLDAIEALEVVRVRHARATLLLAGAVKFGGPRTRFDNHAYEEALRRRAVDLGVGDSVRFLGEHADVRDILAALDLLFVPSWEEPFGRSLAEGMAFGLPAIATTIGGPAELVTDGVDGVLLPPRSPELWGETAAGLLADPARAASLGAAAARTARASFGVERHVADVLAMYGDVRGRAARGALGESRELPA